MAAAVHWEAKKMQDRVNKQAVEELKVKTREAQKICEYFGTLCRFGHRTILAEK